MNVVFNVANMHCGNCALILERIEDELPGIQKISASYHRQQLEVQFDENKISINAIIDAAGKKGYELSFDAQK
jgi:copper chaperone CopZ